MILHSACVIPGIWSSGLSSYSIVQQPFVLGPGFFGDFPDGFFFAAGFVGIVPPSRPVKGHMNSHFSNHSKSHNLMLA